MLVPNFLSQKKGGPNLWHFAIAETKFMGDRKGKGAQKLLMAGLNMTNFVLQGIALDSTLVLDSFTLESGCIMKQNARWKKNLATRIHNRVFFYTHPFSVLFFSPPGWNRLSSLRKDGGMITMYDMSSEKGLVSKRKDRFPSTIFQGQAVSCRLVCFFSKVF